MTRTNLVQREILLVEIDTQRSYNEDNHPQFHVSILKFIHWERREQKPGEKLHVQQIQSLLHEKIGTDVGGINTNGETEQG